MSDALLSSLKTKFDPVNLRQRVISSFVLAPLVLAAIYAGGLIYDIVVAAFMTLAMREWLRMVDPAANLTVKTAAYALLLITIAGGAWQSLSFGAMFGVLSFLVLFLMSVRDHVERAGWIALGIPYLAGSGLALLNIRATPGDGMKLAIYLMVTVWACDIGAYISGRLIGGPKLIPEISPKKTWAGLIGGMAFAVLFGYVGAREFGAAKPLVASGLALALALVSQMGDLFESYVKRRSGMKDSGALIPGHGGVLDRIDGLMFAAVFFVLFQKAAGRALGWW